MPIGQYTAADVVPDPLDFTNKYNTPIPPQQQAAFAAWALANGQDPVKGKYDYDLQGAFMAGAKTGDRGHFTDQFKKPNHPTFSNESQYNGIDGYVGGQWTPQGYQPSVTNLQFRTPTQLAQYFARVEPETKLLPLPPLPQPTGTNGQYRISDLVQPLPLGVGQLPQ